jgi:hypothetical protein
MGDEFVMGRNSKGPLVAFYLANATTCADYMNSNKITFFFFETVGSSDNSGESMSGYFPVLVRSQIPKPLRSFELTVVGNVALYTYCTNPRVKK